MMSGGTPGQVVARGTQDDFNLTTGIDFTRPGFGAGKYMISVFGEGFTVPGRNSAGVGGTGGH